MKIPIRERKSFSEKNRKKEREILRKTKTKTPRKAPIPGMKKAKAFRFRFFPLIDLYQKRIVYLSVICAWNSCKDCTGSLPSRFALRMPSTVARAMAMVVMYGIRFLIAALRI